MHHPRLDHRRRVRVLSRQDVRGPLEERHLAPEAGERLGELAADGTRADDGEPPRQLREAEDRLVGQVAALLQPRNRRGRGAGSRADGGSREGQSGVSDPHRVASGETSLPDEDVDAEPLETLGGIDVADSRAKLAHAGHRRTEVPRDAAGEGQAELGRVPRRRPDPRRPDESLRGDAADIEAVATHQVPLDQRHLGADSRGYRGGHETGRTGADHDEVVASVGRGIVPLGRMDVGGELPVELVVGDQRDRGDTHSNIG